MSFPEDVVRFRDDQTLSQYLNVIIGHLDLFSISAVQVAADDGQRKVHISFTLHWPDAEPEPELDDIDPPEIADEDNDPLLEVPDVAAVLGVHPATVRQWFRQGLVPGAFRPGGKWIILRSNLDAWLNAGGMKR